MIERGYLIKYKRSLRSFWTAYALATTRISYHLKITKAARYILCAHKLYGKTYLIYSLQHSCVKPVDCITGPQAAAYAHKLGKQDA